MGDERKEETKLEKMIFKLVGWRGDAKIIASSEKILGP